jgi:hypothetical protein
MRKFDSARVEDEETVKQLTDRLLLLLGLIHLCCLSLLLFPILQTLLSVHRINDSVNSCLLHGISNFGHRNMLLLPPDTALSQDHGFESAQLSDDAINP